MSFKLAVLCAILAIAQAGYLQPEISVVPTIRYAHSVTPVAIPQPPITYSVPPKSFVAPLPPVITTSYGYKSEHTPVPAPIIRTAPVHVAQAPVVHSAPAFAHAPLVAPSIGFEGHFGAAPLTLGHGLGYAGHFGGFAPSTFGLGGYAGGYKYAAPLALGHGLGYAGHFGGFAPAHFGFGGYDGGYKYSTPLHFGHNYGTGVGLEHRSYGHY